MLGFRFRKISPFDDETVFAHVASQPRKRKTVSLRHYLRTSAHPDPVSLPTLSPRFLTIQATFAKPGLLLMQQPRLRRRLGQEAHSAVSHSLPHGQRQSRNQTNEGSHSTLVQRQSSRNSVSPTTSYRIGKSLATQKHRRSFSLRRCHSFELFTFCVTALGL